MKRKNLLLIAGLLSVISLTVFSCKKDDDDDDNTPPINNPTSGTMTAKVDGVAWTAASGKVNGSIISSTSNMTAVGTDTSAIIISIQEFVALNETYDMGQFTGNSAVYAANGSSSVWASFANSSCYGELTITAIDITNKKMSGTFSFKGFRTSDNTYREITEGVFTNVSYVTELSGAGNTFTIKIDGATFTPTTVEGYVSGNVMSLEAANGSQRVILDMPFITSTATYALAQFTTYEAYYYPPSGSQTGSVSGVLNISSHNFATKTITGTCNFVAEPFTGAPPSYNLTNGSFSITYY